jgi:hypothetical protein
VLRYWPFETGRSSGGMLTMKRFAISTQGSEQLADLEALSEWLDDEPQLRHLVEPDRAVPSTGELGAVADGLTVAVGTGGAITVLASSLKVFLSQPRGQRVQLKVTRSDGSSVELSADRVRDVSVAELAQVLLGTNVDEQ